jgi:hypothetical protein
MRIIRIALLLTAISVTCSSCFVFFGGGGGHGHHGWRHQIRGAGLTRGGW